MDDAKGKHKRLFDPEALFERKRNFNGYRWCPLCGGMLSQVSLDGRARLACLLDSCGFVFYQNPAPAAGVIIHNERGLLLVQRAHPPHVGWWCLPSGYMEWEESPSQSAKREALEETGLVVEIDALFDLYSGDDDPRTNAVLALYLARIVGGTLAPGDDAQDASFFPLENLPDNIAFAAHRLAIADLRRRLSATDEDAIF